MAVTVDNIPILQRGQPWPPIDEEERLQRYEAHRRLFQGRHAEVYRDWIRLLREDKQATLELVVNFPGAVSKLFADLLFGEMPRYTCGAEGSEEQKWLDEFVRVNRLHQLNYKAALAQSFRGEAIYKLRLKAGQPRAVVELVPASIWYPVTDPDNVTETLAHVLAWVKSVTVDGREVQYLRAEIHLPGSVHQRAWLLTDGQLTVPVDLAALYEDPPAPDMETGVAEPLVVVVPNLELDDTPYGQDDYSEADTLFQELDVRLAQIARVLDKHTDPNMSGPPQIATPNLHTGEIEVPVGGAYFEYRADDPEPKYMTWDAQLAANWQYLDRIMQGLYITTDTNAAAFSLVAEGSFPSGAALKRLLMRPLARTNRKRVFFDSGLVCLLELAAAFERANGRDAPRGVTAGSVQIEWRDGLPDDPMEVAQIEQIRTGGKATSSVRAAIRRIDGGTSQAIDDEVAEIAADEARGAPPTLPALTGFQFGETELLEGGE